MKSVIKNLLLTLIISSSFAAHAMQHTNHKTIEPRIFVTGEQPFNSVCFSPDGKMLVFPWGGTIQFWSLADNTCIKTLRGDDYETGSVHISPHGDTLVCDACNQYVSFWNIADETYIKKEAGLNAAWSTSFNRDGTIAVSATEDNVIKFWDPTTGNCLKTFRFNECNSLLSAHLNLDGSVLAIGSMSPSISLLDSENGTCIKKLKGHSQAVHSVCFNPDGEVLASGSADNTIKLWNPFDGTCIQTLTGHTAWIEVVCFSPDGKILASGARDETIRLWNPKDGSCIATLTGNGGDIWSLCFSPDGKMLASNSDDSTIKLWDLGQIA